MTPATQGPVPGHTSGLERVSLNPSHFRSGRWLVLAEGAVLVALGSAGIILSATHHHDTRALGFELTAWSAGLLLGFGVLAVTAALWRRLAVKVTASAAVLFLMMLVITSVAAVRGEPQSSGFDASDIVLYGVLAALNLALLMWLAPDAVEGPAWIPRRRRRATESTDAE